MMLRPAQLRANAEDAAFMVPQARSLSRRYSELRLPVSLIAGADDKVIDVKAHSQRLHSALPQSRLLLVPGTGHMAHYRAQDAIVAAVDHPQSPALHGDGTLTAGGLPAEEKPMAAWQTQGKVTNPG